MIMKMTVMTFCHLSKGIKDSPKLSVEDDKNTFGADSSLQKVVPTTTKGVSHFQKVFPTWSPLIQKDKQPFGAKANLSRMSLLYKQTPFH
jgi:hypothetical protein